MYPNLLRIQDTGPILTIIKLIEKQVIPFLINSRYFFDNFWLENRLRPRVSLLGVNIQLPEAEISRKIGGFRNFEKDRRKAGERIHGHGKKPRKARWI